MQPIAQNKRFQGMKYLSNDLSNRKTGAIIGVTAKSKIARHIFPYPNKNKGSQPEKLFKRQSQFFVQNLTIDKKYSKMSRM